MKMGDIMEAGTQQETGEMARLSSFVGAVAIADLVKSTLGPKGMDKILQSASGGKVQVTNDGATILKSIMVDNPAAKVLVDISKVQDEEIGDGTTSVVVLAGQLLKEAEKLVDMRIHPQTVIAGFREACTLAHEVLVESSVDHGSDPAHFREDLLKIARVTLSSKIVQGDKDMFATLAVDAVLRLKGSGNLEAIKIIKKAGGSLRDSRLDEGFILEKSIGVACPRRVENAKILIANTSMDTDKVKIYGARVRTDSMAKVADIEAAERKKMKDKVDRIAAYGGNVFINRQLIYNYPEECFADHGIMSVEHADFDNIERLALVTGGQILSTFESPEKGPEVLGTCDLVEEIMVGEDKLIRFSGVKLGEACTILLRGASGHVLDEAERSLHDAICVLNTTVQDSRVVLGGGCSEMRMAKAVDALAAKTPGKKSLAMQAFATALRTIPGIISENAGLDSSDICSRMRAEHQNTEMSPFGLDVMKGDIGDVSELGIFESFRSKSSSLMSAMEAAEMILRVDQIIRAQPRQREDGM